SPVRFPEQSRKASAKRQNSESRFHRRYRSCFDSPASRAGLKGRGVLPVSPEIELLSAVVQSLPDARLFDQVPFLVNCSWYREKRPPPRGRLPEPGAPIRKRSSDSFSPPPHLTLRTKYNEEG